MIGSLKRIFSNPQFLSVALVFCLDNLLFTFWLIRIPELKERLALSEGSLGLALFFTPVGAITSMWLGNWLIRRWGEGRITIFSAIALGLGVILPVMATGFWSLAMALLVLGFCAGLIDVSMNVVATSLEKKYKQIIMATCHGFFSLGGVIGAALGGLLLGMGVAALTQMLLGLGVLLLFIVGGIAKQLWEIREESGSGHGFVLPKGALLALAFICFCTMMGEGAVADWSGVYLKETVMSSSYWIAMGYGGFSLFMTLGRFYGDGIIAQLGGMRVVMWGSIAVLLGIGLVLVGQTFVSILGFSFIGLGYSCMVPVVFSYAAKSPGVSAANGIAAVASLGYTGFLLGPVCIGAIAEASNLRMGFVFLGLTALLALMIARVALKRG